MERKRRFWSYLEVSAFLAVFCLFLGLKIGLKRPFYAVIGQNTVWAENIAATPLKQPGTKEDFQELGEKTAKFFPKALANAWEEAIRTWKELYYKLKDWTKTLWLKIQLFFKDAWKSLFGEAKRRQPLIEEEFKKEKEEMRGEVEKEIPQAKKTFWQKIKELFSKD